MKTVHVTVNAFTQRCLKVRLLTFYIELKWEIKMKDIDEKLSNDFFRAGVKAHMNGEHDVAIHNLIKAIELNHNFTDAYDCLGSVFGGRGDYDQAIKAHNKAIKLNPDLAILYYNRGGTHAKNGYLDIAIKDFSKAIELDPRYAEAYYCRGYCYSKKCKLDNEMAVELDPDIEYKMGF